MASSAALNPSLWSPSSSPITTRLRRAAPFALPGGCRRKSFVAASAAFANENREWVLFLLFFKKKKFYLVLGWLGWWWVLRWWCRFVIVGGGNAAGYAARSFVEHGMADGRLCIVTKEVELIIFDFFFFFVLLAFSWLIKVKICVGCAFLWHWWCWCGSYLRAKWGNYYLKKWNILEMAPLMLLHCWFRDLKLMCYF